jgi:hypothetical protein
VLQLVISVANTKSKKQCSAKREAWLQDTALRCFVFSSSPQLPDCHSACEEPLGFKSVDVGWVENFYSAGTKQQQNFVLPDPNIQPVSITLLDGKATPHASVLSAETTGTGSSKGPKVRHGSRGDTRLKRSFASQTHMIEGNTPHTNTQQNFLYT